jgi:hypothetical protein
MANCSIANCQLCQLSAHCAQLRALRIVPIAARAARAARRAGPRVLRLWLWRLRMLGNCALLL